LGCPIVLAGVALVPLDLAELCRNVSPEGVRARRDA
jgi:hypothetical protein